jgi:hypothetical protein
LGLSFLGEQNNKQMGKCSGWSAMLLAMATIAGCQTTIAQHRHGSRILTGPEMDVVTAGSAVASNGAAAHALGLETQTAVSGGASAYSGISPILGAPLLNYGTSQATASAGGDELAETRLSSAISVDGTNGGASIAATAAGLGTSHAQVNAQLYGISTARADVAFGSVAAVACCGSDTEAQVRVNGAAGGPYSEELRAAPVSEATGQVGSRVDITVVSSALPILDQAQVLVAGAPTRVSPKY